MKQHPSLSNRVIYTDQLYIWQRKPNKLYHKPNKNNSHECHKSKKKNQQKVIEKDEQVVYKN